MTFKVKDGLSLGQNTIIDASGNITAPGAINANQTGGVNVAGTSSGATKIVATATPSNTLTLPATTGTIALTSDLPVVNNGTLTLASSGNGISGSGSFTANQSGNTTVTFAQNATSANTPSTIVYRDASGNFSAGTITASLSGNASTVTNGVYTNGQYADPTWITQINYNKLTGTIPTWNQNTTGNAATATSLVLTSVADLAAVTASGVYRAETPDSGFNYTTTLNLNSSDGRQQLTIDRNAAGGMKFRGNASGSGTAGWSAWKTVVDSSNFNSYSPSLTGNGASGTWNISISGSAPTLTTARSINGTSFNGSANITTNSWGTARTITIGSTGKSVDGSAAVSWSLAELGAAAVSQTMFIGTTSLAINRQSGAQTLTGVNIDGNAATATTLQTARSINGTSFNGTADITTNSWGTTRTITLGSTGKSVNGSGDVSWSLAEMGAAAVGQTTHIGTTAIAINRQPGAQTLTGVNIDGNAATSSVATALQTPRAINGTSFNGTANIEISEWLHSGRDFTNGTLIRTDINYGVTIGDPWVIELKGNAYGSLTPFDVQYQGYIYSDTIIHHGGYSNGAPITGMVALNVSNQLCFWIPYAAYWQGYSVKVYTALESRARNRVYSIENSAKPSGTKEVALQNIVQQVHSGNFSTYLPSTTGAGASGTWNINVTGSAGSVAWGNVSGRPTSVSSFSNDSGYITSAGRAYPRRSDGTSWDFLWSDPGGQPTYYLGQNDGLTVRPYAIASMSVNYANSAGAAPVLSTARTINGTNFNGSAGIETSYWGSARTLTVGGTGKQVNGSGNVSWQIPEILSGAANIQSQGHTASWGGTNASNTGGFNTVMGTASGATWLLSGSSNGVFRAGIQSLDSDGTLRFYQGSNFFQFGSNTLTAVAFSGSLSGNSSTATTLQTARNINGTSFNGSTDITTANWGTARTLTIGGTGKSVDGSAAVSWSLAELGAAAVGQTMFIGTTSLAINRTSATQALTGITSIDGQAATLTTARNINGTSFNGSADITTAIWGTQRTFTIGASSQAVNGSSNMSWTLPQIGARHEQQDQTSIISTNTLAAVGMTYVITQSCVLTLPATPAVGNWIRISNVSNTNTITIARNGLNIMGLAEDLLIDSKYAALTLLYSNATYGWVIA